MSMLCPKCHGLMRSYERNGVTVDQCTECRGIFLDRGELEHLIDAEAHFNNSPAPAQPPQPPRPAATAPPGYPPAPAYPPAPGHPGAPAGAAGRSPMADLSTIASIATDYLGKGKNKGKPKKGKKSFIDGLFG